jgi:hypothetical protein
MKKLLYVFIPFALIAYAIYYIWNKSQKAAAAALPTPTTTATAQPVNQWFAGWNGYTSAVLSNAGSFQTGATNLLKTVSNAFGTNDGGANPGVAISGSNYGGTSSSGSGAGNPTPLSQTTNPDIWDTSFTQGDYASAALNNYDVQNSPSLVSSQNAVDTDVGDDNFDF